MKILFYYFGISFYLFVRKGEGVPIPPYALSDTFSTALRYGLAVQSAALIPARFMLSENCVPFFALWGAVISFSLKTALRGSGRNPQAVLHVRQTIARFLLMQRCNSYFCK